VSLCLKNGRRNDFDEQSIYHAEYYCPYKHFGCAIVRACRSHQPAECQRDAEYYSHQQSMYRPMDYGKTTYSDSKSYEGAACNDLYSHRPCKLPRPHGSKAVTDTSEKDPGQRCYGNSFCCFHGPLFIRFTLYMSRPSFLCSLLRDESFFFRLLLDCAAFRLHLPKSEAVFLLVGVFHRGQRR